jgi:hypothetical protein
MKIIIAGSRNFNNYKLLKNTCSKIINELKYNNSKCEIISGNAFGADRLGELFAKENSYNLKIFPANWEKYGKSAGYVRNQQMIEYVKDNPEKGYLIVFWDEKSRGTKNTIDLARKYNIRTYIINFNGDIINDNIQSNI